MDYYDIIPRLNELEEIENELVRENRSLKHKNLKQEQILTIIKSLLKSENT